MIDPFIAPNNPQALTDLHPLLLQMIAAYGHNPVARLLDVDAAMVTRWKRGGKISAKMTRRILDLHGVLARALLVFPAEVVTDWLVGHEPFLNQARPIDVLAQRGSAPLIEALDAIEAGAYA